MFKPETYIERRRKLKEQIKSGVIIFLGNNESPMNYPDNPYLYRQDSSFLYFWGIDHPGLAAIIDVESGKEIILGDDPTIDQIVWLGPQKSLNEKSGQVGVEHTAPFNQLEKEIKAARDKNRKIHFLPQSRADNVIYLAEILECPPSQLNDKTSSEFVQAVINQRSIKSKEEIDEIEVALDITYDMHTYAIRESRPGKVEQEIAGMMEGIALSRGGYVAYPVIFSVHGETLHNHYHGNVMKDGDIAVNDCGSSSPSDYASDITRTVPISGKFSEQQKAIYQIVLDSMESGIKKTAPGVKFKDIHLHCSRLLAEGLKSLGLMKGDLDTAVEEGAHALFFQCGVGHMMGFDVHDMEDLGENLVGYDEETQRTDQFGLSSLRLGKRLQPGYVVTVEPGIYLIPDLIDMWKADNKFTDFINYAEVEKYRDFGGIRIEENVFVTENGYRILGKPIPKTVADVEEMASD